VIRAAGVESARARWARKAAGKVFVDRKLVAACTAENGFFVELRFRPRFRSVDFSLGVALKARIPTPAAAEFYRDDV